MNNNELCMIDMDTYIGHIDDKVRLYAMLKHLACMVRKLPINRGSKILTERSASFEETADKMFASWSIPRAYLITGDVDCLADRMMEDLAFPNECGYVQCEEDCGEEAEAAEQRQPSSTKAEAGTAVLIEKLLESFEDAIRELEEAVQDADE